MRTPASDGTQGAVDLVPSCTHSSVIHHSLGSFIQTVYTLYIDMSLTEGSVKGPYRSQVLHMAAVATAATQFQCAMAISCSFIENTCMSLAFALYLIHFC